MASYCAAVFDTAIMLQEKEGNLRKFSWKVAEYIVWVSISMHRHSMPVIIIGAFLVVDKFVPDCQRLGVFVNVSPYGEFKVLKKRP